MILYTAQMKDGSLFYMVGVSPEQEFRTYQPVINRVASSIRFLR
jgi:3-hydroxyisobutyrate dehydrogenase-like beta-hydroxyacid dehydrogenase